MLELEFSFMLVFLFVVIMSLPAGFFVIKFTNMMQIRKENIVPISFVMVGLGLAIDVVIMNLISYVFFNIYVAILPSVAFLLIDLILIRKKGFFTKREENEISNVDTYRSKTNKFFLLLFIFVFLYLLLNVSFLLFPNVGDAWTHGRFVAMILFDGKMPINYLPFDTDLTNYPLGFHIVCAAIVSCLSFEIGATMLTFTAVLLVIICILLTYIVFRETKSVTLSSLAAFLFFQVHPSLHAEMSILATFLNGTYTVILGILIVVTSIICLQEIFARKMQNFLLLIGLAVPFSVSLFLTYPSFLVILISIYGFCIITSYSSKLEFKKLINFLKSIRGVIVCGVIVAAIGLIYFLLTGPFKYIIDILLRSSGFDYRIQYNYFVFGFQIPVIITTSIISAYRLVKDPKWRPIALSFLVIMGMLLLSVIPSMYDLFLWRILPERAMLLIELLAICFCLMLPQQYISKLISRGKNQENSQDLINSKIKRIYMKSTVLAVLASILSLTLISTFNVQITWSSFTRDGNFQNDLEGMRYFRDHYDGTKLVLNYGTPSEWFLPTMGLLNPIYGLPWDQANYDRLLDTERIWLHPENQTLVQDLITNYQINFIFVSSMTKIYRFWNTTDGTYQNKSVASETCSGYFMTYPFLTLIYDKNNCAIFQTVP